MSKHKTSSLLSSGNVANLAINIVSFCIIFYAAYSFDLFGFQNNFPNKVWAWIVVVSVAAISTWLYNTYAVRTTAWVLGRSDEI